MSSNIRLIHNKIVKIKLFSKYKIVFLLLLFIPTALLFYLLGNSKNQDDLKEIHYHAGFLVYIDGKLQDFSDFKYMHLEPCSDEKNHQEEKEDDQLEKAHLHDGTGDVVHVHRNGAVWNDLFKNIGFTFPDRSILKAFSGGSELNNFLETPIKPYDSIIIASGDTNNINLSQYVTYDRIKEVEAKSESCGS